MIKENKFNDESTTILIVKWLNKGNNTIYWRLVFILKKGYKFYNNFDKTNH